MQKGGGSATDPGGRGKEGGRAREGIVVLLVTRGGPEVARAAAVGRSKRACACVVLSPW